MQMFLGVGAQSHTLGEKSVIKLTGKGARPRMLTQGSELKGGSARRKLIGYMQGTDLQMIKLLLSRPAYVKGTKTPDFSRNID